MLSQSQATPMLPGGQGTEGGPVSDTNAPNLPDPGGGAPAPEMDSGPEPSAGTPLSNPIQQGPMGINPDQVTTKPRQMPGGGDTMAGAPGMPMDFPPTVNGANLPDTSAPPGMEDSGIPGGAMDPGQGPGGGGPPGAGGPPTAGYPAATDPGRAAALIRQANPRLPEPVVRRLVAQASRYLAVVPPERPQGTGEPLEPGRPARPADRGPDAAMASSFNASDPKPDWYTQRPQDPQQTLANAPVEDPNTLFRQRGGL